MCFANCGNKITSRWLSPVKYLKQIQKALLNYTNCFFVFSSLHSLSTSCSQPLRLHRLIWFKAFYFPPPLIFLPHAEHLKRSSHYSALIKSVLHGSVLFRPRITPSPLLPSTHSLTTINTTTKAYKRAKVHCGGTVPIYVKLIGGK